MAIFFFIERTSVLKYNSDSKLTSISEASGELLKKADTYLSPISDLLNQPLAVPGNMRSELHG